MTRHGTFTRVALCAVVAAGAGVVCSLPAAAQPPDAEALLECLLQTQQEIDDRFSMKVVTKLTSRYPGGRTATEGMRASLWVDGDHRNAREGRLDSQSYWGRSVYDGERYVGYSVPRDTPGMPRGGSFAVKKASQYGTGYRIETYYPFVLEGWEGSFGEKRIGEAMLESGTVETVGEERIGGTACRKVRAGTKYGRVTYWIAPEKSCQALRLECVKGPEDLFRGGKLLKDHRLSPYIELPSRRVVEWTLQVDQVELARIGGIHVPVKARKTETYVLPDGSQMVHEFVYRREEIDLDPEFPPGTFAVELEDGAPMTPLDGGGLTYRWQDGEPVVVAPEPTPWRPPRRAEAVPVWKTGRFWIVVTGLSALLAVTLWVLYRQRRGQRKSEVEA